jgi:predicted acyltransferase
VRVAAHHVESLDVFRGVTVAAMILVNNPGDWSAVFPSLLHAYWTGWTSADLVFPWFIFIMGVAMPFAFARRHGHGQATFHLYRRIARRVAMLIVLGLVVNAVSAWPPISPLRFPGVLQRIALSYLIAAVIVLNLGVGGWVVSVAVLLLGHWALLMLVPFGGHPAGTLTPEHNVARYVDTLVFGRHMLRTPNDPEGLLGTLPAAATALVGALTGELMRRATSDRARLQGFVVSGLGAVALGWMWSRVLPLSKPLWTGSYVCAVTGLAMLALAFLYFIVDMCGVRSWARPFLWLGVNPLAIYFLSEVVGNLLEDAWTLRGGARFAPKEWVFWRMLEPALRPWPAEWASFAFGIGFVAVWVAVAGMLYQRRIRIQV